MTTTAPPSPRADTPGRPSTTRIPLRRRAHSIALGLLLAAAGCGPPRHDAEPRPWAAQLGRLSAAFSVGDVAGIDAVRFAAVPSDGSCDDEPIANTLSKLESEDPPQGLLPAGAGAKRRFADGFLVLAPGQYKMCATPLTQDGTPSEECGRAEGKATVMAEATTEVVLVSQCAGNPTGGLDTVVVFNSPPQIDKLEIRESKFITTCETTQITVAASDPNGDQLSYLWRINGAPAPGAGSVSSTGNSATFTPGSAGDYEIKLVVADFLGATTSLTFPVHVTDGVAGCQCPAEMLMCGGQCRSATCSTGQPRDPISCACPSVNLALNPSCSGSPSPEESDHGWGGGSNKCEIVDGLRSYDIWAHGLAFTGGHYDSSGGPPWLEPAGVRHMVIDLGSAKGFEKLIIWWHGVEHTPQTYTLEVWDGTVWVAVEGAQRAYGTMHEEGTNSGSSTSDIYTFPPVTASKVRYSFDNSDRNIDGGFNVHGWIYEVELFSAPSLDCVP